MKVFMISPYSVRKVTGVGTSIIDLCRELDQKNVKYILIVPAVNEQLDLEDIFQINSNYFEAKGPDINFLKNFRIILFNLGMLLKYRKKIDVVHLFSIKSITAAGAFIAKIINKPVVTTIYIIPPAPKNAVRRMINNLSISAILRLTDNFAYETRVAQSQCGNRPGSIIPEGIDTDHFKRDAALRTRIRTELGIGKDQFVLLYSGRLIESKGIVELLKAASSLPDSILKQFKLLLIGNIESDTIETELEKLRDRPWFIHQKPVGRDEIKNYYCCADGFVLPSYYEGISSSLIEAMACGLPPIVTNVGGNVEVVSHGKNGLVVELKSVEDLRKNIEGLISDKHLQLRLSKAARSTVVKGFSLGKKAKSYNGLYRKVISEKKE